MDGTAGVAADGDGDSGSCSNPKEGDPRPSTPPPAADRKYVCLRSLVGASSSSSSASREAMLPGARKVLDVGARLWVPVASDGSSGSDTDGGVGSPSSPASTLREPLLVLRGRSRHGLHGGCRDAELQAQAREGPLQPHPLDYEPHLQVLERAIQYSTPNTKEELDVTINRAKKELEYEKKQKTLDIIIEDREKKELEDQKSQKVLERAIQCSTPNTKEELDVTTNRAKKELEYEKKQKTLGIIIEDREKKELEDQKRQKVVEEISNNVKDISVRSSEIVDRLKCMSSHVNQELAERRDSREKDTEDQERQKVVEQISIDVKDFAATSWVIAEHLESLSSCADKILQIKIEEREKRETEEKSQKEDANFLKECQSMLSDFVFFMLAFIPWLLHKNEETPSTEYYCLTFSVSGLVLFGISGYVLPHLARSSRWIKAVYWISGIAIMATILLVVYVLFELIPSSFQHMTFAFWVYLCLYLGVGLFLLMAWIHNFVQA